MENLAIKNVFGSNSSSLLISATKSSTGHLQGATGSLEAIFATLAVYHGITPPTLNLQNLTSEFDLDYVPLVAKMWTPGPKCDRRIALTNSYGFGGTNASICIAEYS